ncbi:multidrug resistance-associated protein 1-like isoform X2 [Harmonia axyridis]|uniref:multidrug resistance-associated protein 1-like isoform X2 n=1 Tax=Harmonia axyridis TaxID=115357 RepID=UPI001E27512F|nr:multidrug resistance-associated protein 1-like isoform X2 [Harmonia axyridis]
MDIGGVLTEFCGSEFWNSSLSWHTNNPDLTICFEKTALTLIPCSVLWIFSAIEIFHISKSREKHIPWNWRNVSKLIVLFTMCIITLMELVFDILYQNKIYLVDVVTPLVKLSSFILVSVFIIYNRKKGIRSSGVQFFFWLILAICGLFQLRTEIKNLQIKHLHSYPSYLFYTIYYSFVLLLLFLSSLNDRPVQSSAKKNKNICPEEECSFLSRLFFSWIETLAWKGFRKPLTDEDLYDLRDQDSARHVVVNFDYHWTKKLHRKKSTNPKVSVLPICLEAFLSTFIFGILLKFSSDLLAFVSPQILSLLINFVKEREEHWKGYFYAVLLLSTGIIKSLLSVQYSQKANVIGLRIRVALNAIIYRKALKLSSKARQNYTIGEIVNLISNDTKNIADLPPNLISVISAILQVILSLYFLWKILGIAVISGLIVMILMIPISSFISNKLKNLQIKKMKSSDQRIKQTNEVLSNFKVLKLYAWESIFHSNILRVREIECQHLKNTVFYNVGYSFVWLCAPFLVSLVCFATYVLIDDKNILDARVAFVSLSLFNILRVPMNQLPATFSDIVQASVSLMRVNKMLSNDELDPDDVTHYDDSFPLTIKNGTFGWGEEPTLKNINISLPKSSLTAIVGSVGSGKSTFLSAFLGETHKFSGQVNTVGNIAYVPQQAWIQNATLRENILFGKPYDRMKYQRVVGACALKSDFQALPGGDNTEIGEKGVNLSGGQRQRISLARAVYADADIYFLDDPLSAVDTRVGRHIFERVIGPNGILKSKTRVFVTHSITYLPQTNEVIVLKNGEVSERGTYQQLLDKEGDFSDFLKTHKNEDSNDKSKQHLRTQKADSAVESIQMSSSVMSYDKLLLSSQDNLLDDSRLTDIEKLETGSVGWDVYKYYLETIGWKIITAAIVSNFFMHLLNIGGKVWLSVWSTDPNMVNNGTNDYNKTLFYLGVYSTFGFGKSLLGIFAVLAPQIGGVFAAIKLHQGLLHRIIHAPMSFFDTTPTGRLISRFAKDIGTVDYKLSVYLYEGINSFFIVIGTLIVTSYTAPVFIAVIIPLGLVYYLIQKFYIETSRQLKRLEAISRSPIYSLFNESVAGAPVIRAFKAGQAFTNDFERKSDFNNSCYYLSMISNRWMSLRLEILGNLIVFFSVMFSVTVKHLNAGLLGLSITYALEITETLNYLVRIASEVETNIVSVERIREYAQASQEAPWDNPDVQITPSWPDKGIVEFKRFGVRYRPGLELVLRNVNFKTNQNEKIGIVGRTGAGKSSLTLSLFRILEAAEGEILIDGVNLATLGLQTLRSRITIIPQDAVLFSGTLRMNLDPYNKYTDNEIWQTLQHAHLKSYIQTFPEGLEHLVSEGGENFSMGQKQLICLARALLRKTKVLILDEATAAVDLETDNLIQITIRNEFSECTVLTIAHRLNTILDYDRVIVLNKGTIEEFDSPTSLLKNKGLFYDMCKDDGITQ